jgi:hypothetical protein
MRNTTLSTTTLSSRPLVTALVAGVFALAATATAPAHAQVLGRGSLAGGLAGGLGGQARPTVGQMEGRIGGSMRGTGMGDIGPGVDLRAAERHAERLRKRADATAALATGAVAHATRPSMARRPPPQPVSPAPSEPVQAIRPRRMGRRSSLRPQPAHWMPQSGAGL